MDLRIPPSRLERRVRLLLRAYPPGYRADRGEEMLGTLLEATPDGRDWPPARDSWSLLACGIGVRRAASRRVGPAASLRQAVALGLALYLSWAGSQFFTRGPLTDPYWTPILAGLLLMTVALAVWAGRRTLAIATGAASLAVLAYYWDAYLTGPVVHWRAIRLTVMDVMPALPLLLAMLALVQLTRRDGRPPRSWLILICAPPLAMIVERELPSLLRLAPAPGVLWNLLPDIYLLLAIPALAWLVTDARPALGIALAAGLSQVVPLATLVQFNTYLNHREPVAHFGRWLGMDVEKLALAVTMTVALGWMLRRRTRPQPRQKT